MSDLKWVPLLVLSRLAASKEPVDPQPIRFFQNLRKESQRGKIGESFDTVLANFSNELAVAKKAHLTHIVSACIR